MTLFYQKRSPPLGTSKEGMTWSISASALASILSRHDTLGSDILTLIYAVGLRFAMSGKWIDVLIKPPLGEWARNRGLKIVGD